ncbi:MAG: MATE family efflux transporter [Clostridia bacterium]|nr:MATE family efflux transporter [Clostridia bacterium]
MTDNHELDLTKGSILKELIIFSLPILGVNILQLLFNTADTVVLGRFAAPERATVAVGAVGATGTLINLFIGFFIGLSLGANVVVAKAKGAGDKDSAEKYVGCSVLLSVVSGVVLLLIGFFGARSFLYFMNCKDDLLDMATTYLKIYSLGMPIIMLYNFSAAILRAVGDTFRPLIFLVAGGILNVVLNIFFVTVVGLDVEGVAIATVASNFVSAVCCFVVMLKSTGYARLKFSHLKFYKKELKDVLLVGVPSGLQKVFFSISNVFIQANINSFGSVATAGNSVGQEIDKFLLDGGEAIAISTLSFTSQNMGAGNVKRVKETIRKALILIMCYGLVLGGLILVFDEPLVLAIRNDAEILPYAQTRLSVMATTYFICNFMGVFAYVMRGMGKSVLSMIISIFGGCVLRIIFIMVMTAIFPESFLVLFITYPMSWTITVFVQNIFLGKMFRFYKTKEEIKA